MVQSPSMETPANLIRGLARCQVVDPWQANFQNSRRSCARCVPGLGRDGLARQQEKGGFHILRTSVFLSLVQKHHRAHAISYTTFLGTSSTDLGRLLEKACQAWAFEYGEDVGLFEQYDIKRYGEFFSLREAIR